MLLSEMQMNEFFGFSKSEKEEKLKNSITSFLSKNEVKLSDIKIDYDKNDVQIDVKVKSAKGIDFNNLPIVLYYYIKQNAVRVRNTITGKWKEVDVVNSPASAACSLIFDVLNSAAAKQRSDKLASDQRAAAERNSYAARKREIEDKVDQEWRGREYRNYMAKYYGAYHPDKPIDLE